MYAIKSLGVALILASELLPVFGIPSIALGSPVTNLSLSRQPPDRQNAGYLHPLQRTFAKKKHHGITPLTSTKFGHFLADVQFGSENFKLIVDTRNSFTWVAGTGLHCLSQNITKSHDARSSCGYGPLYKISSTFKQMKDGPYNVMLANYKDLYGAIGEEHLTLAGITAEHQTIGVIDEAVWGGDDVASGVLGLALDSWIKVHEEHKAIDYAIPYRPLLTTLHKKQHVHSLFSLALERPSSSSSSNPAPGGQLAIGGLPNVAHASDFARTPFQQYEEYDEDEGYIGYAIHVEAFLYNYRQQTEVFYYNGTGPEYISEIQVVIDSATPLIRLPRATADAVNKLFDPPASYDASIPGYKVDCLAKAPRFGIRIASQAFYINHKDLIMSLDKEVCISSVDNMLDDFAVLGSAFLKNVVAVFDIKKKEMRFAAREDY